MTPAPSHFLATAREQQALTAQKLVAVLALFMTLVLVVPVLVILAVLAVEGLVVVGAIRGLAQLREIGRASCRERV